MDEYERDDQPPPPLEQPDQDLDQYDSQDRTELEPEDSVSGVEGQVRLRYKAGEFDAAVEAFETAPFDQYTKHIATRQVVQADDTDNRYYVSLDGDLYLCLERSTAEENLVYICSLDRSN
jgi:hypothetical protein